MKNHKQLLADFYLALLAIPKDSPFRLLNAMLYEEVLSSLAKSFNEDRAAIKRIFEKMALEDKR